MTDARVRPEGPTPGVDELSLLLEQLEQTMPELSSEVLDREVNELLGRSPEVPTSERARTTSALASGSRRGSRDAGAFEWFGQLVARWPVLDREEIVRAAIAIEAGLFAEERLATANHDLGRRLTADLHEVARSGQRDFARLVLSNLRLVFHWSKGVAWSVDSDWAQDAFQAGCIGLMRGIQGWDYRMGFTLSTFVSWHVRQAIQRWRANDILLIRIPVHVWESLDSNDKPLTPSLRVAADRAQNIYSLDEMTGEEPWFECDGGLEDAIDELERAASVNRALDGLELRESRVLRMRFGLSPDATEPMTLEDIGTAFGFTRERARQIEAKAKAKLKVLSGLRDVLA